jgi:imidazolonepropionase-like amidohydrolase
VGSLAKGKDADLVVFNGDLLDARARVEKVMIEGQWVLERGG